MSATTVTCARCSRVTSDPKRDHWSMRAEPLVVQGVTLGLCGTCLTGAVPPAEKDEKRCDGCKGDYRPKTGTYFEAQWGDSFSGGERWSCWDQACAEGWLNDQPFDCGHCGSTVDMDLYVVTNGDRKRVQT